MAASHDKTEGEHLSRPGQPQVVDAEGGWGWVVCLGSFAIHFITDGTLFSFGVILLELLDAFHETKARTAWVGSALLGFGMLAGPLVSLLLQRFSIRQVTICGSLVSAMAFVVSIFSPSLDVLILTYGVIGGVGFSFLFLPSVIVVGLYFSKRRAIATGIATSGSGFGVFVYPWLCDRLIATYNWQGTVLISAGLVLNCVVCGAVFRPIALKVQNRIDSIRKSPMAQAHEDDHLKLLELPNEQRSCPGGNRRSRSVEYLAAPHLEHLKKQKEGAHASAEALTAPNDIRVELLCVQNELPHQLLKKDILYGASLENLREYQESGNRDNFLTQMTTDSNQQIEVRNQVHASGRRRRSGWKSPWFSTFLTVFSIHLFRDKTFLLLLVTFTMWTVQAVPLTYLPHLAVTKNFDRSLAALLVSIIGITNTIGRVLAGFVLDLLHLPSIALYVIALLGAAIVNLAFPWCNSFALLATCSAIFGLCMAVAVSMRTIVLADHLGIDQLINSFGIVALFQGIAFMVNPPLAGMLLDVTGDYVWPFAMAAMMYFISAFCSMIVLISQCRRKQITTKTAS